MARSHFINHITHFLVDFPVENILEFVVNFRHFFFECLHLFPIGHNFLDSVKQNFHIITEKIPEEVRVKVSFVEGDISDLKHVIFFLV